MRTKRTIPDYSDMPWRTVTGDELLWRNLDDHHLANIYGYFVAHPNRYDDFSEDYPYALEWLKQEATRRGKLHLIESVLEYGPYPFFNESEGAWFIYDAGEGCVPIEDYVDTYGLDAIPPDVRDLVHIRILMSARKRRRNGRRLR